VKAHSAAEIAVGSAPGSGRLAPRLITPETMRRSVREKRLNTRYVTDILPETEPADSLLVVEVRTRRALLELSAAQARPARATRGDAARGDLLPPPRPAPGVRLPAGVHRRARHRRSHAVEDHDTVVVPRGYHPVVVPWGLPELLLNVMAGPQRAWHFKNDPAHEWIIKK